MAYSGSIDLISGIRTKNNGTFPLVNAADVYVDDSTRLSGLVPCFGTAAEWAAQPTFVPARGRIVIWTDHEQKTENGHTVYIPGYKIGDGNAYNLDLPFLGEAAAAQLSAALESHLEDTVAHITAAERARWNKKITAGTEAAEYQDAVVQVNGQNVLQLSWGSYS